MFSCKKKNNNFNNWWIKIFFVFYSEGKGEDASFTVTQTQTHTTYLHLSDINDINSSLLKLTHFQMGFKPFTLVLLTAYSTASGLLFILIANGSSSIEVNFLPHLNPREMNWSEQIILRHIRILIKCRKIEVNC